MPKHTLASLKSNAINVIDQYEQKINPAKKSDESLFRFFARHVVLSGGSLWKGKQGRATAQQLKKMIEIFVGTPEQFMLRLFCDVSKRYCNTLIGSQLVSNLLDYIGSVIEMPRLTQARIEPAGVSFIPVFITSPEEDGQYIQRLKKGIEAIQKPLVNQSFSRLI